MIPICMGCGNGVVPYQLYSGVALSPTESIAGHYRCVVQLLGPERTLKAFTLGLLPLIQADELDERGQLKAVVEKRMMARPPVRTLADAY